MIRPLQLDRLSVFKNIMLKNPQAAAASVPPSPTPSSVSSSTVAAAAKTPDNVSKRLSSETMEDEFSIKRAKLQEQGISESKENDVSL